MKKILLPFLAALVFGLAAQSDAQQPIPIPKQPGKGVQLQPVQAQPERKKKQQRLHFDQEVQKDVPVIGIPDDELVPVGRMSVMATLDWGVQKLNAPEAHKTTKGKGVKVCVLDTGLDYTHPDFGGVPQERMRSFVPGQSVTDVQGHGTHCMGRVAARGVNYGMAPEAEIWAGKVLGNDGSGAVTWIARGIDWATEQGVDVISLSLGGGSTDSYIPPALARAEAAGVLVAAAAGNDGPGQNTVDYPGGYPQVVCVGAVDSNLNVASFSSRGGQLFSAMPGVNIVSQYPGNRQAPMSGTSMATPHEAGQMALWIAANPSVPKTSRPAEYRKARSGLAQDLGPAGRDSAYGYGFIDANKMVAGGVKPPDPKEPTVISFTQGDFTPSGLEKLKKINPNFQRFDVVIKP